MALTRVQGHGGVGELGRGCFGVWEGGIRVCCRARERKRAHGHDSGGGRQVIVERWRTGDGFRWVVGGGSHS